MPECQESEASSSLNVAPKVISIDRRRVSSIADKRYRGKPFANESCRNAGGPLYLVIHNLGVFSSHSGAAVSQSISQGPDVLRPRNTKHGRFRILHIL